MRKNCLIRYATSCSENIYTARRRKAPLPPRFGAFMGRRLNFSAGREHAYGNGTAKNLNRVQKILNFSARVITGWKKFDYISDVQRGRGWPSAPDLVRYHTLMLAHKVLRNGEPEELADLFSTYREVRERSTRQDDALRAPRCRTACGQRRFAYRAAQMYQTPSRLP